MADTEKLHRRRVYLPPKPAELEEIAALLCQKMDRDSEFEAGFGGLLKSIAKAYANHLSRSDDDSERLDSGRKTP